MGSLVSRITGTFNEAPVRPAIIVLGSGFAVILDEQLYIQETERAANEGFDKLMNGGSAVDAVEEAVRILEGHDHFNAGRGSCLNEADKVECDAMIMDGHNLKTGAIITARHFLYPVSIARKIMDKSRHCALSGEGALKFIDSLGLQRLYCNPEALIGVEDCPNQRRGIKNDQFDKLSEHQFGGKMVSQQPPSNEENDELHMDSVGAVAIDRDGHLACACSAGGIPGKLEGRVSDASLVGCGGYANEFGAATVTGHGESLIKLTLARQVVYNMEQGQSAQEAAENAVKKLETKLQKHNHGGVVAIDRHGKLGIYTNIKRNKFITASRPQFD